MYAQLLSAIEADLNKIASAQQTRPLDVDLAAKKLQLKELAMDYIKLENRYREISKQVSIY